jgi:hypothetical protein
MLTLLTENLNSWWDWPPIPSLAAYSILHRGNWKMRRARTHTEKEDYGAPSTTMSQLPSKQVDASSNRRLRYKCKATVAEQTKFSVFRH